MGRLEIRGYWRWFEWVWWDAGDSWKYRQRLVNGHLLSLLLPIELPLFLLFLNALLFSPPRLTLYTRPSLPTPRRRVAASPLRRFVPTYPQAAILI